MKDLFKLISILILIVFSFYYSDKISSIIINKSSLMHAITNNEDKYYCKPIDAIINGDNIIPGINGIKINKIDSYYKMKDDNVFSEDKITFEQIIPTISIENNKDLIINQGNSLKNVVSIIVKDNNDIINYSINNNIFITRLVTYNTFNQDAKYEQINIDSDYSKLDTILNKYKINTNICYLDYSDKNTCTRNHKYIVDKTYSLLNAVNFKNKLSRGDIIFIEDSMSLSNYKIILKEINYRDLKIDFLSNLISEENY